MTITKEKTKHFEQLHFEHKLWKNEIGFYKDELVVFKRRLQEVVNMYTDNDILAELEHFQNQFILQNEQIEEILHDINELEQRLTNEIVKNPVAVDHRLFADQPVMRERISDFMKIYRELRNDFMRFLSKVM